MSKIYSVVNKKGGVGKSSSVSAIASICAHFGEKVLVIDLDPQTDSTKLFYKGDRTKTIKDIFRRRDVEITYDFVKNIIEPTEFPNIDIIVGDEDLDEEADLILLENGSINKNRKVEIKKTALMMLTKAFQLIKDDYDLILIDNTPYFNLISKNALSASNGILIPVNNDGFSYDGLTKLLRKIYEVKSEINSQLDIIGVFFTCANSRTTLFKQLKETFKGQLKDRFLDTYISTDNTVKEANTYFIPLYEYTKEFKKIPNATRDYMMLILELKLLQEENHKKLVDFLDESYKNF